MYYAGLIIFFGFFVLFTNIFLHKWLVNKALNNYIIPDLINKKLVFIGSRWTGFFSTGDFNYDDEFHAVGMLPFFRTTYLHIYYRNGNKQKNITAKIETGFLSIRKVTYSREIKNASV